MFYFSENIHLCSGSQPKACGPLQVLRVSSNGPNKKCCQTLLSVVIIHLLKDNDHIFRIERASQKKCRTKIQNNSAEKHDLLAFSFSLASGTTNQCLPRTANSYLLTCATTSQQSRLQQTAAVTASFHKCLWHFHSPNPAIRNRPHVGVKKGLLACFSFTCACSQKARELKQKKRSNGCIFKKWA